MNKKTSKCYSCNGKGYYTAMYGTKAFPDFIGDKGFEEPPSIHKNPCSACNGTGKATNNNLSKHPQEENEAWYILEASKEFFYGIPKEEMGSNQVNQVKLDQFLHKVARQTEEKMIETHLKRINHILNKHSHSRLDTDNVIDYEKAFEELEHYENELLTLRHLLSPEANNQKHNG